MGMAASQARLLSLTGRLHDVELKAQNLMSQKVALATQKDELYQEYCDALDATTIKVACINDMGETSYVNANFSSICLYSENRVADYTLIDSSSGKILVTKEMKENYDKFGNDRYTFAWAMLGLTEFNTAGYGSGNGLSGTSEDGQHIGYGNDGRESYATNEYSSLDGDQTSDVLYMTEAEAIVYKEAVANGDDVLKEAYEKIGKSENVHDKQEALTAFRELLYSPKYAPKIFDEMNRNKNVEDKENYGEPITDDTWDELEDQFNYYCSIWESITEQGGCKAMDPAFVSGDAGTEWFNNMVTSGQVLIKEFRNGEWQSTSVATSSNNNYLQEMEADDKAIKKAEAKYEHELEIINRKDTKFDTELSKLETERTSITTEIDSIKKVRDDNVERTFGIFS